MEGLGGSWQGWDWVRRPCRHMFSTVTWKVHGLHVCILLHRFIHICSLAQKVTSALISGEPCQPDQRLPPRWQHEASAGASQDRIPPHLQTPSLSPDNSATHLRPCGAAGGSDDRLRAEVRGGGESCAWPQAACRLEAPDPGRHRHPGPLLAGLGGPRLQSLTLSLSSAASLLPSRVAVTRYICTWGRGLGAAWACRARLGLPGEPPKLLLAALGLLAGEGRVSGGQLLGSFQAGFHALLGCQCGRAGMHGFLYRLCARSLIRC